jgi:putative DNA primase/helicase
LTGGDRLTGRFLHKEFFDFDPTHKVVLVTNHRPTIQGQEHAIWRRVLLLPFSEVLHGPAKPRPAGARLADKTLTEELKKELPGILAWAVEGCRQWQEHGLDIPDAVRAATEEYKAESDSLKPFIEECCEEDPNATATSKALYACYASWTEDHNESPMTSTAFGTALTERGFKKDRAGKERTQIRRGLRLLPI